MNQLFAMISRVFSPSCHQAVESDDAIGDAGFLTPAGSGVKASARKGLFGMRTVVRISLRNPAAASSIAERVSLCVLVGLALVSVAAAVEHMRSPLHPAATVAREVVRAVPPAVPPVVPHAPSPVAAAVATAPAPQPAPVPVVAPPPAPGPAPEAQPKTPEPVKIARNLPLLRDMSLGEADRGVPSDTATVIARQRDLPMLRDEQAFQTWGGEFAKGDGRLKEMIQAGALTSVERGAKIRILEIRGDLAHVEIIGQRRTGWIRSSSVGR